MDQRYGREPGSPGRRGQQEIDRGITRLAGRAADCLSMSCWALDPPWCRDAKRESHERGFDDLGDPGVAEARPIRHHPDNVVIVVIVVDPGYP